MSRARRSGRVRPLVGVAAAVALIAVVFGVLSGTPADCAVTTPDPVQFVPPEPWNPSPSSDEVAWFGSADLWTVIDRSARVPRKSVWWSANFPGGEVEETPEIEVTYERRSGGGDSEDQSTVINRAPGTNAYTAEDGWFMINGLEPDEPGCWRATATYKGATLSYVYQVR